VFYIAILLLLVVVGLIVFWTWTGWLAAGALKTVPQIGSIRSVEGGAIHFTDAGPRDRQTLVLIHGLSGNLRCATSTMA